MKIELTTQAMVALVIVLWLLFWSGLGERGEALAVALLAFLVR